MQNSRFSGLDDITKFVKKSTSVPLSYNTYLGWLVNQVHHRLVDIFAESFILRSYEIYHTVIQVCKFHLSKVGQAGIISYYYLIIEHVKIGCLIIDLLSYNEFFSNFRLLFNMVNQISQLIIKQLNIGFWFETIRRAAIFNLPDCSINALGIPNLCRRNLGVEFCNFFKVVVSKLYIILWCF